MKKQFKIGKHIENDIVIRAKDCPDFHAEINYEKGHWNLRNLVKNKAIIVNNGIIETTKRLNKSDTIKIGKQTIYWSNYLYEGDKQELYIRDIISYNGRISRSNFRALSLLSVGMVIAVYFLPGLLIAARLYLNRRRFSEVEFDIGYAIQEIAQIIHTIGFMLMGIILVLLAIKRIRDTGHPIWKLLIPIYNLKILYFEPSKR